MTAREAAGRDASPSVGVIDSQSVKSTESGGLRSYDLDIDHRITNQVHLWTNRHVERMNRTIKEPTVKRF